LSFTLSRGVGRRCHFHDSLDFRVLPGRTRIAASGSSLTFASSASSRRCASRRGGRRVRSGPRGGSDGRFGRLKRRALRDSSAGASFHWRQLLQQLRAPPHDIFLSVGG
jgi:hypothetical protein